MSDEALKRDATDVARLIATKEMSCVEVTQECLQRIEAVSPALNCFISFEPEQALEAARTIDDKLARGQMDGPLAGVPLAHKDMYYREGVVTTCGSRIRREFRPKTTATVLERLVGAGAINLGGLNMAEFATGPTGHNEHFGDCKNPWNTAHAPGGSSSGSGAAVAARLVYGALGSDTGGSIRIPSAMCGVVGLKPTHTRVSRHGMMPLCFSFDTAGPLTRTVRDAALMLSAIAGEDVHDASASTLPVDDYVSACGRSVKGMRIGIAKGYYGKDLSEDVGQAMQSAREEFVRLGCELVEVDLPEPIVINALWEVILQAEAASIHREWLCERREEYSPQVRRRLEIGLFQPATRYLQALSLRPKIAHAFVEHAFSACDVLHLPTLPCTAPTLAELAVGDSDDMPGVILSLSRFTRPFSFLGLPSLSVPCGFGHSGLPVAFQLVGRPFSEATLCAAGDAYQRATPWHEKLPSC